MYVNMLQSDVTLSALCCPLRCCGEWWKHRKEEREKKRCKLCACNLSYNTPRDKISCTLLNADGTSHTRNTAAVWRKGQWGPMHLKCI